MKRRLFSGLRFWQSFILQSLDSRHPGKRRHRYWVRRSGTCHANIVKFPPGTIFSMEQHDSLHVLRAYAAQGGKSQMTSQYYRCRSDLPQTYLPCSSHAVKSLPSTDNSSECHKGPTPDVSNGSKYAAVWSPVAQTISMAVTGGLSAGVAIEGVQVSIIASCPSYTYTQGPGK